MSLTASIIILTYNNLEYNRLCLESILEKTDGVDFEVVVVDNASGDGTPQFLQEFARAHPQVRLILNETNAGFARGNNQGAAAACGGVLVFLNNDTVVTRGWLRGLLRHLEDPTVGMVGPVTNAIGNESRIRVDYAPAGGSREYLEAMEAFAQRYTAARQGQTFEIGMLALFCVAIRREVWEAVGPLDERFGIGMFEDDDYSLRLKTKGYRLLCAEDVFVHHWGSAGFGKAGMARYYDWFLENRKKFEQKWGRKWQPPRLRDELLDEQIAGLVEDRIHLSTELIARDREIERLAGLVEALRNSPAWKIGSGTVSVARRLAPPGSRRSRLAHRLYAGALGSYRSLRAQKQAREARQAELLARREVQEQRESAVQDLEAILARRLGREIVVFVPTVYWNVPLFQRPQQMALAFARLGCLVFYCDVPGSPDFTPGIHPVGENLWVVATPATGSVVVPGAAAGTAPTAPGLSLEILRALPSPVVFTLAYNTNYLENFTDPRVVYEYIDELSVFYQDPAGLQRAHAEMLRRAEVVVATADRLLQQVLPQRPDTLLCPNAVDEEFFRKELAAVREPPEALQEIVASGKPVIGYYGAHSWWFDYDLLAAVARQRPGYQFVLIGPDLNGALQESTILSQPNIYWLGPRPYRELPGFLKYFDVATIPFQLNEVTHSTSPLKLYEYMSAGKPVVTTPMRECLKYPQVLTAADAAGFVGRLDQALALRDDPQYRAQLEAEAKLNTWAVRARQILEALAQGQPAPAGPVQPAEGR